MRRKLIVAASVIAASFSQLYAGAPVNIAQLPKSAQTFLAENFPGDAVRKAEMDRGFRGPEYEVDLMSGAEIEFRDNGDWKEVKAAKGCAVPSGIVPEAIAKFVADHFAGLAIEEIARKRGGYEVELSNGTELKLTEDARPL
ncbi:MAG: PepSY-like domain-containing protein [Muribaculaceae bacterium]|nr:PepSY-like domain-containing protein [Muribaculaceae bacterium]